MCTGEAHQGGADDHNGGKHTSAGRGTETRAELDAKTKQETELTERGKNKNMTLVLTRHDTLRQH